jgi:hypothetical protein
MNEMIKLSVVKAEYFTNFKKQTVTCKLTYRIKVTDRKMVYLINYIGGFVDNALYIGDTYTVVSTAKTLPGDKFDIHKGEQIARAKAESKAYSTVSSFFSKLNDLYTEKLFVPMGNFIDKSCGVIDHNNEFIGTF